MMYPASDDDRALAAVVAAGRERADNARDRRDARLYAYGLRLAFERRGCIVVSMNEGGTRAELRHCPDDLDLWACVDEAYDYVRDVLDRCLSEGECDVARRPTSRSAP